MPDLLFSGVQPTNNLHIGNYIGALKQWTDIQHRYRCFFCVVDLHAITVPQDPKILRQQNLNVAASYVAVGVDPARCNIFIQSEIPEHTELAWILSTLTKIPELERMTQFKDKAAKHQDNVGVGLFTYPLLMAADILLYDTTVVPVGDDQMQHLELTRTIGKRFNTQFGETFVIPQPLIQKLGARIMSLDDPQTKMSKSAASAASYIALSDSPDTIRKKISKAVTDSGTAITYDAVLRPAISNLLTILHHTSGRSMKNLEQDYAGKGYADFKRDLAESIITMLEPVQKKLREFQKDPGELTTILDRGRAAAQELATVKIKLVRDRIGLGR